MRPSLSGSTTCCGLKLLACWMRHRRSNQVAGHAERDRPEAERGAQREVERRHRSLDDVPALHAVGRQRKVRIVREARVRIPVDPPAERDVERAAHREPADPGRRRQRRRAEQIGEARLAGVRALGARRLGSLRRRLRMRPARAAQREHAAHVQTRALAERDARRVEVERRRVGRDHVAVLAAELRRGEARREGRRGRGQPAREARGEREAGPRQACIRTARLSDTSPCYSPTASTSAARRARRHRWRCPRRPWSGRSRW